MTVFDLFKFINTFINNKIQLELPHITAAKDTECHSTGTLNETMSTLCTFLLIVDLLPQCACVVMPFQVNKLLKHQLSA